MVGLFSQHLLAFLATTHQVWHHHFSWAVGKVLVDEKPFVGQVACDLVGESLQLPKSQRVFVFKLDLLSKFLSHLNTLDVVRCNEQHVIFIKMLDDVRDISVVALVGVFDVVPDG